MSTPKKRSVHKSVRKQPASADLGNLTPAEAWLCDRQRIKADYAAHGELITEKQLDKLVPFLLESWRDWQREKAAMAARR